MTIRTTHILTGALLALLTVSVAPAQRPRATAKAPTAASVARIDSTRDEFANTTTVNAVNVPRLGLNGMTILYPEWACDANQPCALSSLRLLMSVPLPTRGALTNALAKAEWDDFVKRVFLDWDFVVETPNDTLRFSWAIDSLSYVTFTRRDREAVAAGDIHVPGLLDALPVATRILVRQRFRSSGDLTTTPRIIEGTSAWLDRVQRSHRRLTDGRRPQSEGPT